MATEDVSSSVVSSQGAAITLCLQVPKPEEGQLLGMKVDETNRVLGVAKGSLAEASGIMPDDVLLTIDGTAVRPGLSHLLHLIEEASEAPSWSFGISRGSPELPAASGATAAANDGSAAHGCKSQLVLQGVSEERTSAASSSADGEHPSPLLQLQVCKPLEGRSIGLKVDDTHRLLHVMHGSAAAKAGLKAGDVIVSIDSVVLRRGLAALLGLLTSHSDAPSWLFGVVREEAPVPRTSVVEPTVSRDSSGQSTARIPFVADPAQHNLGRTSRRDSSFNSFNSSFHSASSGSRAHAHDCGHKVTRSSRLSVRATHEGSESFTAFHAPNTGKDHHAHHANGSASFSAFSARTSEGACAAYPHSVIRSIQAMGGSNHLHV